MKCYPTLMLCVSTRWTHWLHPWVSRAEWSKREDIELIRLSKAHGLHSNWEEIAQALGPTGGGSRSGVQCLARYQRSLNGEHLGSTWTAVEDQALRDAVRIHGVGNWNEVCNNYWSHLNLIGGENSTSLLFYCRGNR